MSLNKETNPTQTIISFLVNNSFSFSTFQHILYGDIYIYIYICMNVILIYIFIYIFAHTYTHIFKVIFPLYKFRFRIILLCTFVCPRVCVCLNIYNSFIFKQVWLNNKDTFYLYNFIKILSSFLISVLVSFMDEFTKIVPCVFGPFISHHQGLLARKKNVFKRVFEGFLVFFIT